MNRVIGSIAGVAATLSLCAFTPIQPDKKPAPAKPADNAPAAAPPAAKPAEILTGKMKLIDGSDQDLAKYKGKVVVIVNVASKCGYTAQYEAIEQLYKDHKDQGLVILAFPANDFNSQEPGANSEIAEFCKDKEITFPLFEKISVKGENKHELYKKLAALPAPLGGDPKWNFTKFVVDKTGKVVARVDAKAGKNAEGKLDRSQLEPELIKKVSELLGIKEEPKPAQPPASKS